MRLLGPSLLVIGVVAGGAHAAISSSGSVVVAQQGSTGPFAAGQTDTTSISVDNADILLNVSSFVGLLSQPGDVQIGYAGLSSASMTIRSTSAIDFTLRFSGDVAAPGGAQGPVRFAPYIWNINAQNREVRIDMETVVEGVSRLDVSATRAGSFNGTVSGQSAVQPFSISGGLVSLETIIRIQVGAGSGQSIISMTDTAVRTPWLVPSPGGLVLASLAGMAVLRRRR